MEALFKVWMDGKKDKIKLEELRKTNRASNRTLKLFSSSNLNGRFVLHYKIFRQTSIAFTTV